MADTRKPRISKSRSGCSACKKKRMKCDESVPECKNCVRRKISCPGYKRALKWSTKYEKFQPPPEPEQVAGPSEVASSIEKPEQDPAPSLPGHDQNGFMEDFGVHEPQQEVDHVPSLSNSGTSATHVEGQPIEAIVQDLLQAPNQLATPEPEDEAVAADGCLQDEIEHHDELVAGLDSAYESGVIQRAIAPRFDPYLSAVWSYVSDDEYSEKLVNHYFDVICQVMSCFDSATNPYRTDIPRFLTCSPHIFDCLMTMSAAHMANHVNEMTFATLRYQTKAMSYLQEEMSRLALDELAASADSKSRYQLLLGTIILGMTSGWHDPNAYALSHLKGARMLFRAWSKEQGLIDDYGHPIILNRDQSFIVGSMSYWEALASVLTDQPLETLDYLKPFCELAEGQTIYPHSWTGVCTPIFVYLAQTGVLLRQKRVLEKLVLIRRGCPLTTETNSGMLEDAQAIHDNVLNCNIPSLSAMEDTGDPNTPLSHLCDVAKVYRFVILMELYLAFPTLLGPGNDSDAQMREMVFDLATSALTILSNIPRTSGVFTVLALAYICSGSAIQTALAGSKDDTTTADVAKDGPVSLGDELNEVRHSRTAVQWWRDNVRQQIMHSYKRVGIASLQRGAKLVQEVWNRSDLQTEMASNAEPVPHVHWIDVMIEQRLETLYG